MQTKNLIAIYDESETYNGQVAYLMENEENEETGKLYTREEAEERTQGDHDIYAFAVDDLHESLGEHLNGNEFWYIEGTKMGWRNLNGHKYLHAATAKDLINGILPDTECTIYCYKHYKGFKIKVSHHDSPMGEWYIVKPITENEYEKNS